MALLIKEKVKAAGLEQQLNEAFCLSDIVAYELANVVPLAVALLYAQ